MDELLYHVFAEGIGRYLDAVERLAARLAGAAGSAATCSAAADSGAARELRRLVAAWRALLAMHRPEGRRCAGCDRCRDSGMCGVLRVANAYFVRRLPGEESVTR